MYAQLYYRSEEGNVYPKTDRLFIADELEGLLTIPSNKFKKGYATRVNIYSFLAMIAAITFGVVMSSGLFIFLGFSVGIISYLSNCSRNL